MACRREEEGESWSCCPSTWRLFEASCYFISTTVQSWNQSQQTCAAWQAELAVIRTSEEQDFITQSLEGSSAYYIGLSDPEGHRRWQWVDQTPYNASATFWHPGEPNGLEECCVELSFRGATGSWGWNDVSCQLPRGSVCRMPGVAYEGAACAAPTDSWLRPCELGAVPVPFPAPQG
ncbi:C-type lectin domain family 4 member C-like isoform X2 [Fukomys damarensis]|uniref:C-type lectin domain family 4 member C-like isoform X2 n=1 Tax=Fukomys damarensis TaxID=885580 RepID=UPI00053FF1EC|nr:C-type lectin domain family 4 member C-like isoform X2 [Fukomys damarensis]